MSDVLRGQGAAFDRVLRAALARTLPHGLIVEGVPGGGKSTAARRIAAALLCRADADESARQACAARVARGTHPDLHRLERPEDRQDIPVDAVRELQATLERSPLEGGARVAIVDPADRLNEQGQNALLKTLEEPPTETWILLVTARPEALLETVRSRAGRLRVRPLPSEAVDEFVPRGAETPEERERALRAAAGSVGLARYLLSEDVLALDRELGAFLAAPDAGEGLLGRVLQGQEGRRAAEERARTVLLLVGARLRSALRKELAAPEGRGYSRAASERWLVAFDALFAAEDDLALDVPPAQVLDGLGLALGDALAGRPLSVPVRSTDRS